ncbi:MAG: YlxR family protein [Desulfovibrio sp.]|uniref:YlxR family protein n=1 Tax=Desulfovibrio sp. 7SRBS1 TaxID=3378064 RepID=UPI003B405CEE
MSNPLLRILNSLPNLPRKQRLRTKIILRPESEMGQGPERTCVVCRRKLPKDQLVRHVCHKDGQERKLILDENKTMPGRGFYHCRESICSRRFAKYSGWRTKCKGD